MVAMGAPIGPVEQGSGGGQPLRQIHLTSLWAGGNAADKGLRCFDRGRLRLRLGLGVGWGPGDQQQGGASRQKHRAQDGHDQDGLNGIQTVAPSFGLPPPRPSTAA